MEEFISEMPALLEAYREASIKLEKQKEQEAGHPVLYFLKHRTTIEWLRELSAYLAYTEVEELIRGAINE